MLHLVQHGLLNSHNNHETESHVPNLFFTDMKVGFSQIYAAESNQPRHVECTSVKLVERSGIYRDYLHIFWSKHRF